MRKSLKLIIFDCDGTLVDSQHMIVAAMHEAYRGHGLAVPDRTRLLSIVGLSLTEAFRELGAGDPQYPVASLASHYRAAHAALRQIGAHQEPLFPGAAAAITPSSPALAGWPASFQVAPRSPLT